MIKAIIFCLIFIVVSIIISHLVSFISKHFPDLLSTVLLAPLKFF